MAQLPLESLRYFEAAARHESFAKAARELRVTPAAVAYRVKMVETHIRAELFDRRHRGVRLNDRGRAYLADVQRILGDLRDATERLRGGAPAAPGSTDARRA